MSAPEAPAAEGGPVVLDGLHAVKHGLRFGATLVDLVALDPAAVVALARELAPDVADRLAGARLVDTDELRALTGGRHPTGVAALALRPQGPVGADPRRRGQRTTPTVLLEDPRHAGNTGAAIRVAAAAGASGVLTTGSLDPWHPACVRGAAGLQYALPVLRLEDLGDVDGPLLTLTADGEALRPGLLPDDAVLCVGTERGGLSAALRERADAVVALPMREGVSSLNLATAVAAALYAWRLRG